MNMVNTTYKSTEVVINKIQDLNGKTKIKFYTKISHYYDEINIRNFKFEDDPFVKNAQGISKIYQELLLSVKFLQTKPQVKNMNINHYGLFYTAKKSGDDNEVVVDKHQENENDYIIFNDFITHNHNISMKTRETVLKWRRMRSVINFYENRQTFTYRSV